MNMNMHAKHQSGFTLIELLLYVTIVGSLLIVVSLFFAMTVDARLKHQSITEVDQQGTLIMEEITRTIRLADTVAAPSFGATTQSLELTMPTPTVNPTRFELNSGTLQIREGTANPIPLSNDKVVISNLNFRNLSREGTPGLLQISFTLARVNPSDRTTFSYEKTFTTSIAVRQL